MADQETEAEWAKSKRIEAERMKAAKALAETKADNSNLAYLDPRTTKIKGFSRGREAILLSVERLGNFSAVMVVGGVIIKLVMLSVIGLMLNSAGQYMRAIIDDIGMGAILVGMFVAVFVLLAAAWFYYKYRFRPRSPIWTAGSALIIGVIYTVVSGIL